MNKKLLLLFLVTIVTVTNAQISTGGIPYSFNKIQNSTIPNDFEIIHLENPSLEFLQLEDETVKNRFMDNRIGINLPLNFSYMNEATVVVLDDGSKLYRLGIRIDKAKALGLYFSAAVEIPEGAEFYVYNANKKHVLGAFTHKTDGFKALEMVQGDYLVLEYYTPAQLEDPIIELEEAVYFYRGVEDHLTSFLDNDYESEKAGTCQVDINCSEGASWQQQKRGVVFYTFSFEGNTGSCTGSMINNTAQDCKPYVLTAFHCGGMLADADISQTVWYWNYEKPGCSSGNGNLTDPSLPSFTMTGGIVKASAGNGSLNNGLGLSEIQGTDFLLVELASRPPQNYQAFLNGWNRSTVASSNGAMIHHPDGSAKKIATYSTTLQEDVTPIGNFWIINWAPTSHGHGLTEGGSSGAPVFNSNAQIIGQSSWSTSASCTTPDQFDGAGMLSTSWNLNGSSLQAQLQPWLDPLLLGTTSLAGLSNSCSSAEIDNIPYVLIKIFPNPASSLLNINVDESFLNEPFSVNDITGRVVIEGVITGLEMELSLSNLKVGHYFFQLGEKSLKIIKQ